MNKREHSRRTKAALRAAKARGTVLGANGAVLAKRHKEAALARAQAHAPLIRQLRAEGLSVRKVAAVLNECGIPSPGGGKWHTSSAHKLLCRIEGNTSILDRLIGWIR